MTTWKEIIKTGDVNAVKDYIAQGADVNAKDNKGNTALHYAQGWYLTDIVEYLKLHGAK